MIWLFLQSSAHFQDGYVLTADQLNSAFASKMDVSVGIWLIIFVLASPFIGWYLNRRFPEMTADTIPASAANSHAKRMAEIEAREDKATSPDLSYSALYFATPPQASLSTHSSSAPAQSGAWVCA